MYRFILTLSAAIAVAVILAVTATPQVPSFLYQTSLFLLLVTCAIYRYLYNQKDPQLFVQIYLATMAFKLLIYGAYTVAMILIDRGGATANVAYFLSIYVLATALEVVFLYRRINDKS